jgi:hypothetical protein
MYIWECPSESDGQRVMRVKQHQHHRRIEEAPEGEKANKTMFWRRRLNIGGKKKMYVSMYE